MPERDSDPKELDELDEVVEEIAGSDSVEKTAEGSTTYKLPEEDSE